MVDNTQQLSDPQERRVFERFSARFPAKFKDTREGFGDQVYLRNASAQGAQLACTERLFLNDRVSLEVELPDGYTPMQLRGEVVWAEKSNPNFWDIGLRFHKIDLVRMSRIYKFIADEHSAKASL